MRTAEFDGQFDRAANYVQAMLDLRKQLHEINSFFIMSHEDGYQTGVWYWKVIDRKAYYQSLADKIAGVTGNLVAVLPKEAKFSIDPRYDDANWSTIRTTKPFYAQGYMDQNGFPYVGNIWYRLQVNVPLKLLGKRCFFMPRSSKQKHGYG